MSKRYGCIGTLYGDLAAIGVILATAQPPIAMVWVDDQYDIYVNPPPETLIPNAWIVGRYSSRFGVSSHEFENDLRTCLRERSRQSDSDWKT
jgi:hypothetical protein